MKKMKNDFFLEKTNKQTLVTAQDKKNVTTWISFL